MDRFQSQWLGDRSKGGGWAADGDLSVVAWKMELAQGHGAGLESEVRSKGQNERSEHFQG